MASLSELLLVFSMAVDSLAAQRRLLERMRAHAGPNPSQATLDDFDEVEREIVEIEASIIEWRDRLIADGDLPGVQ